MELLSENKVSYIQTLNPSKAMERKPEMIEWNDKVDSSTVATNYSVSLVEPKLNSSWGKPFGSTFINH